MILGVFTGLTEHGGIQRYGHHAAAVIAMLARDRGEDYRFLGLNDPAGKHEIESAGVRFSIEGFARNKPGLIRAVLSSARATRIAYLNHPNLAPLGLALRALNPGSRYIVSTYGFEVWEPLSSLRGFALQRAERVTAIAEFNAVKVAEPPACRAGENRVDCHAHSIQNSRFRAMPRRRQPRPAEPPILLW